MKITGFDTILFASTNSSLVFSKFAENLKGRWGQFMNEDELRIDLSKLTDSNQRIEFFFCRDKWMSREHESQGYSIGNHDGCCMLIARAPDFKTAAIVIQKEQGKPSLYGEKDPYSAWLIGGRLIEFTLVTPSDPQSNEFSRILLGFLLSAITVD